MYIGDRESDIYELFCECDLLDTKFVFRTCVNRLAGGGETTVYEVMEEQRVRGVHRVEVGDCRGRPSTAVLEIKYEKIKVCPPTAKAKRYGDPELTMIHAPGAASRRIGIASSGSW